MFFHRRGRMGTALRPIRVSSLLVLLSIGTAAPTLAADITGQVVDATGRALPRAYVRVVSENGTTVVSAFTDEAGRFSFSTDVPASCRVEASLTGFQTAMMPCTQGEGRMALALAPVSETVIVSATRTEAPTSQVGASATVFTASDLERLQEPLLADLLVSTPGAMLIRNGGPGTVTSLFVRGGESNYNKVLLDGVPLNEPGGTYYLNNLTTENLDRVEIIRGAYSSLFGSDAMASVIQLVTKRPDRTSSQPHGSAQIDGGTYGTVHATAGVSGAKGRFDYSLGAARFDSDNRVPNSALTNNTLSANVGAALGDTASLRLVARAEREHVGTPGQTAFGRPDLDAFFERNDGVASVQFNQRTNSWFRQRASYSLATSYQQSTDLIADPTFTATYLGQVAVRQSSDFVGDTANRLHRHHADYQADLHLSSGSKTGDQLFTVLADWDGERVTAINRQTNVETPNARDNFGVSVQEQMLWRRVFVTVGGRVEKNESFGTAFVPRGTIVYVLHPPSAALGETIVKASAGTGVKEPNLLQSFSLSPYFLGNPDLKPERARSAEVGIEQRFAGDRAKFGLTYFNNRFSDVIQLITTNPATYEGKYFNTGVTRGRGIELTAEAAPVAFLRARAGYTMLDGKVVESAVPGDTVFGLGHALFRRPRNSGSVGATVVWQRISGDVNGTFVGKFVDSDFGLFSPSFSENPGHTVWDTRVSVVMTRRLTGLLTIDNLTNRDYSEPLGYQPLLRTVRVGARVRF
jgi:outer membrane cobalamin receptor